MINETIKQSMLEQQVKQQQTERQQSLLLDRIFSVCSPVYNPSLHESGFPNWSSALHEFFNSVASLPSIEELAM